MMKCSLENVVIKVLPEVKGRKVWDDAKVKFRVAKEGNPWAEWEMHQKDGNAWIRLL